MPDLVIVCFGLNDVNGELDAFLGNLKEIFSRCQKNGTDVIFMTPNMLNTYVSNETRECNLSYAKKTAKMQAEGKMDLFMDGARRLCVDMGVTLCDCYAEWKKLSQVRDTTLLLANRINHPTPEMHKLFSDCLYNVIIGEDEARAANDDGMLR